MNEAQRLYALINAILPALCERARAAKTKEEQLRLSDAIHRLRSQRNLMAFYAHRA